MKLAILPQQVTRHPSRFPSILTSARLVNLLIAILVPTRAFDIDLEADCIALRCSFPQIGLVFHVVSMHKDYRYGAAGDWIDNQQQKLE